MAKFLPGQGGRPKGVRNKTTRQLGDLLDAHVFTEKAWKVIRAQAESGTLPAPLMVRFFDYKYGKPKEQMELTGKDGGPIQVQPVLASQLSVETLEAVVRELEAPKDEETQE